jgi:hypothetical protein
MENKMFKYFFALTFAFYGLAAYAGVECVTDPGLGNIYWRVQISTSNDSIIWRDQHIDKVTGEQTTANEYKVQTYDVDSSRIRIKTVIFNDTNQRSRYVSIEADRADGKGKMTAYTKGTDNTFHPVGGGEVICTVTR